MDQRRAESATILKRRRFPQGEGAPSRKREERPAARWRAGQREEREAMIEKERGDILDCQTE